MYKILVMTPCNDLQKEKLLEAGGAECVFDFLEEYSSSEERKEHLRAANVVIGEPDLSELKENANIEWIQMTWAGTDKYTKKPGFPLDIILTNASGAFGTVIAEYLISVLFSLYRRLPQYWKQQSEAVWKEYPGLMTLEGKTVLVLGAGDIGCNFAQRTRAFGTYNIGIRRTLRSKPEYFHKMYAMNDLDELLPRADVVACCLPNTYLTEHLIGEKQLRKMKKSAVLLNVGRGNLVKTDELVRILQEGHLFGAALDVTDPEPLPLEHPLWKMENVIITPHISGPSFGNSPEIEDKIYEICSQNIKRFISGEKLLNRVDFDKGY